MCPKEVLHLQNFRETYGSLSAPHDRPPGPVTSPKSSPPESSSGHVGARLPEVPSLPTHP